MGAQQYAVFRLTDVTKLNNGFVCLKSWGKADDMLGKPPFLSPSLNLFLRMFGKEQSYTD